MADYNPNTISMYKQYGQSMMAAGGGSNMSGLGAKPSSSGKMSSRFDSKGFTPTASKSTASGAQYVQDYGDDSANIPMTPEQIYAAAAEASTQAGSIFAPEAPKANAMNLYSMPNMVESVSDYVYRADRDDAITSAISGVQAEEQASVDEAIKSINNAITLGKTDAEIAETFLNDMGGFGNDKPDETGGFGVPGVILKDVTGTDEGALSNPQPLYDFAEEMANPSITTTELPPMSPEDQASLGAAIRKAAEEGTLQSKLTNIQYVSSDSGDRTDPSFWDRVLFGGADGITEEEVETPTIEEFVEETYGITPTVDPETGQTIKSADDVANERMAEMASQGLMSRRMDTKGNKVTDYDTMLYSEDNTDLVKGVQGKLTDLGYVPRGVDGITGAGTSSAIRHFQEQNNLSVTGTLTDETLDKLKAAEISRHEYDNVVTSMYDTFSDIESDEAHLGVDADRVGITLAYGIVPDRGLKYSHRGNIITLPDRKQDRMAALRAAGVTAENFNPDNVIIDDVEKEGVKRADYRSDEEYTKAVIQAFTDKVEDKARSTGVELSDDAKQGLVDYVWNAGTGTLRGEAMTNVFNELASDTPNYTNIGRNFLNRMTENGRTLHGLGARRAEAANELLEAIGSPVTFESYRMVGTRENPSFVFDLSDGTSMRVPTPPMHVNSSFPRQRVAVN